MTAESGRERRVILGATEKTLHCGFHKLFFFRASLIHRIQINNSENTDRYAFITWTVKDVMNRLGQSSTDILIHSKLKVLLGDGFIHPLALDTHVSAPVLMRLCKSDEQKCFLWTSSRLVLFACVKDVTADNMQEKWMGGGDGVLLSHSKSDGSCLGLCHSWSDMGCSQAGHSWLLPSLPHVPDPGLLWITWC